MNLIYPSTCYACGQRTERPEICGRCLDTIATPASPLCARCGIPFQTPGDADHLCARCLHQQPRFGRARACTVYSAADSITDPLKTALQHYKYTPDVGLAGPLAAIMLARCPLPLSAYDVIVPVPLHLTRLRWRGFNQAHLLAHHLARSARVPLDALSLERVRPTRPQVHLNESERRQNVIRAFLVTRPERVRDARILLVDDVYTTGATVNECSRALLRAGAASADVLVLARAVLR